MKRDRIVWAILVGCIVLHAAYFSVYQIRRHRFFATMDMVSVEQPIWNTVHGRFMRTTYYPMTGEPVSDFEARQTETLLADHVQPLLLALALPYALFPATETLIVLMCVTVALGAFPMYSLALRRLRSPAWALAFAIGYLLLPVVQTNSAGDLHGLRFVPTLLLAALDAAERGKRGWWVWALLAMGAREDVPLLAGWALVWLAPAEKRREAWWLFGVGSVFSLVCFIVIIPGFGGGGTPYLARFFPLGTAMTPAGILGMLAYPGFWRTNLVNFIAYNIRLGLPLLFLYFLHWPSLLAIAPVLVMNGFSWFPVALYPNLSHYSALAVPWILIGAVEGLLRAEVFLRRWRPHVHWRGLVGEALFVSLAATTVISGYTPFSLGYVWPEPTGREPWMEEVLRIPPAENVVSAESHLGAHLAQRVTMRFFPDTRDAEWILMDFWGGHYFYITAPEHWRELLTSPEWETVRAGEGLLLLRRGAGPPRDVAAAFAIPPELPALPLQVTYQDAQQTLRLQGVRMQRRTGGVVLFCTDWQREGAAGALEVILSHSEEISEGALLDGLRFYPNLFSQPGAVRDCTQFIAGSGAVVRLAVRDAAGDWLPAVLETPGAWEGRVQVASPGVVTFQLP